MKLLYKNILISLSIFITDSLAQTSLSLPHEITYCVDPNFMPYEQISPKNTHEGIVADYISLLQKKTKLNFKLIPTNSYEQSREFFAQGKCLVISADAPANDQKDFFNTDVYFRAENGMIVKSDDTKNIFNFEKGTTGYIVGADPNYIRESFQRTHHSSVNLLPVKSEIDGIRQVTSGEIKRYLSTVATLSYNIEEYGIIGVRVIHMKEDIPYCMQVNKAYPELVSKLNEGIRSISASERQSINQKWIKIDYESTIDYKLIWRIASVTVVILFLFGMYNWKIRREKKFIQTILDSQKQILAIFQKNRLNSVNQAFLDFFEILSLKEFTNIYATTFLDQLIFSDRELATNNINNIVMFCKNKTKSLRATIVNNDKKFVFSVSAMELPTYGDFLLVLSDITEIENSKLLVEQLHQHTKQSIEYASIIQLAILPDQAYMKSIFQDSFLIWQPKDIVGGDMLLFDYVKNVNQALIMVIDCTGHGVAGAMITMLVKALQREVLSNLYRTNSEISTSEILTFFNQIMKKLLNQEDRKSISNAGFDAAIVYYNKTKRILKYSGAQIPLYIKYENTFQKYNADKHSIGYKQSNREYHFSEHRIDVKDGMELYISTDGFCDQNGGADGFPMGRKRLEEVLTKDNFHILNDTLKDTLLKWKGDYEYNDDITVLGIKL